MMDQTEHGQFYLESCFFFVRTLSLHWDPLITTGNLLIPDSISHHTNYSGTPIIEIPDSSSDSDSDILITSERSGYQSNSRTKVISRNEEPSFPPNKRVKNEKMKDSDDEF